MVQKFPKNSPSRFSWLRWAFAIPEIVVSSVLSICVENLAICTMWFGDWYDFYIVQKEADATERSHLQRQGSSTAEVEKQPIIEVV